MLSPAKISEIEQEATQQRNNCGITSPFVDPNVIAASAGITVMEKGDCALGVSGVLVKSGDNFGIMYSTRINNEGYQRFSIAHELGHYFLPDHPEKVIKDGVHSSHAGYAVDDTCEREADYFATCLLMPKELFRRESFKHADGLAAVKALSATFKTSMIATAIRHAELSKSHLAIIVSSGGIINFSFCSKSMRDIGGISLPRKGQSLPKSSGTLLLNRNPDEFGNECANDAHLQDWLGGHKKIAAQEEAITLGEYGRTLTILTLQDDPEDEEDSSDEWEPPRFR
ncbi:MAG: ImmA/IrrE family metallo-endopeptidase [Pseudomonadota bacterium]